MSTGKKIDFDPREVVIASSALKNYKEVIRRQLNKEPVGSDVREVFERRLNAVQGLLDKVTSQGSTV